MTAGPSTLESQPDLGRIAQSAVLSIPAKSSSTLTLDVGGRVALSPDGWYRLDVFHQTSLAPDDVEISVTVPEGWRIADVQGIEPEGERRARAQLALEQPNHSRPSRAHGLARRLGASDGRFLRPVGPGAPSALAGNGAGPATEATDNFRLGIRAARAVHRRGSAPQSTGADDSSSSRSDGRSGGLVDPRCLPRRGADRRPADPSGIPWRGPTIAVDLAGVNDPRTGIGVCWRAQTRHRPHRCSRSTSASRSWA